MSSSSETGFTPSTSSTLLSSSFDTATSLPSSTSFSSSTSSSSSTSTSTSTSSSSSSSSSSSTTHTPSSTSSSSSSSSSSKSSRVSVSTATVSGKKSTITDFVTRTPTNRPSSTSTTTSLPPSLQGGGSSDTSSGLSHGGVVAIAVVIPIVVVALLVLLGIFFWRRRRQRKNEEEARRKEVEEYGYNPNDDPTYPAIGMVGGADSPEMAEDTSGYRGWGNNTNGASYSNRKASTTLSGGQFSGQENGANGAAIGQAISEDGEPQPSDALMYGQEGYVGGTGGRGTDIQREPSNASSSYSLTGRSEVSAEDAPFPDPHNYSQYAPYNPSYGEQQPVVRDVSARRATRIESPTFAPQQGNSGISQNF